MLDTVSDDAVVPFDLDQLVLDERNMRTTYAEGEIELLAESLQEVGLLQNLGGVRLHDGKVGIVAGGRRLAAMQLLAEKGVAVGKVPVKLADSFENAQIWSMTENAARRDVSAADEVVAYRKLAMLGRTHEEIAASFGVSVLYVRRRLKLADLPDDVIDALRKGEISVDVASAFTVSPDEKRTLEVLSTARTRRMNADMVRRELTEHGVEASSRLGAFVGSQAYEARGGTITRDLFSERVIFDDASLVEALFLEKLQAAAEAQTEEEGWLWAEVSTQSYVSTWDKPQGCCEHIYAEPGKLTEPEQQLYEEIEERSYDDDLSEEEEKTLSDLEKKMDPVYSDTQKGCSGVIVFVNGQGQLAASEGWVRKQDEQAAIAAGVLKGPNKAEKGDKPIYSGALMDDLKSIELCAVQAKLLSMEDLLLDLLAYDLARPSTYYGEQNFNIQRGDPRDVPTKEEGLNRPAELDDRADMTFAEFRALPDENRRAHFVAAAAKLFDRFSGYQTIKDEIEVSMRDVWTPTAENFFSRITSPALSEVAMEVMGWDATADDFKSFEKYKKGAKAKILEAMFCPKKRAETGYEYDDAAIARIEAWTPKGF